MITNFSRTINHFSIPIIAHDISGEEFIEGEYVETLGPSGVYKMMPIPFKTEQLRYLLDGSYTVDDYKFLTTGSGVLKTRAIILYNGHQYRISEIWDRTYEGNFTEYFTKKIKDSAVV